MAALLLLGLSSGLPLFLPSQTLQAWMTQEKVDLGSIGLFSLVSIPYSLKFLWSPLVDRYVPPVLSKSLGRRRSWLALTQLLLALAIAGMFFQQPTQALQALAVNAVFIAFFSATQDIVADAYRSDVLEEAEMGAGIAVFVLGYRIALILTGSIAFILADRLSWPVTYLCMAGLMLLNIGVTLFAPEPQRDIGAPPTLLDAVWRPFQDFVQRSGWQRSIVILIFIVLYRYGDALLNNMATPFLLNADTGLGFNPETGLGFTQTDIGAIKGGMGLLATIVGTLLGGSILSQIGIARSLWIFGGLQALSNVSYFILSKLGPN
ncbi:MAG: AmpG family muropeptide MFS transporter, partial [Prochlorotrichaceae cyanobacterium]